MRLPGEIIESELGGMCGHGTYQEEGEMVATVGGLVEEVGKLKLVKPVKSRYVPQTGDVVVGRIQEIGRDRFMVDINSFQMAILSLTSVYGKQRIRTAEDQLAMRQMMIEDDLVSCEVQEAKKDGSVNLHTRSAKYGKLGYGVAVRVLPSFIKRLPQHFHHLPCDVDIIVGMNGLVWIQADSDASEDTEQVMSLRERICRVRNAIEMLRQEFVLISPASIMAVYEESLALELNPKTMLDPRKVKEVVRKARERQGAEPDT